MVSPRARRQVAQAASGETVELAGGAVTNITLTFDPDAIAAYTSGVRVVSSDLDEGTYDFAVRGDGITPPTVIIVATSDARGSISPSGTVELIEGQSTNFTITADTYYHVDNVFSNAVWIGPRTTLQWINVTNSGSIHAAFAPDLAAHGTPHWWLAGYGLTNAGLTFDEAEIDDDDEDGATPEAEFIMDTAPDAYASCLRITALSNGVPTIVSFSSSSNRYYTLEAGAPGGPWSNLVGQTLMPGLGGPDALLDAAPSTDAGFYRIRVTMP